MNGACKINLPNCTNLTNPPYAYVQSSDMQPYLKIAQLYGYANYFFQTNQGPSFPAHQFLLSGTSAPDSFNDPNQDCGMTYPCWQWFAAENYSGHDYGCIAPSDTVIKEIPPVGNESHGYHRGFPCYDHNTLVDLLDTQSGPNTWPITWRYYPHAAGSKTQVASSLWNAPNAITGICGPPGTTCNGADWVNNVERVFPNSPYYLNSFSPILTDLGADPAQPQCTLPNVSWVIPDGRWSDHASEDPQGAGPSWVSAIINAVGGFDNDGNPLPTNCGYWNNTAILVVWDDWGGWYDHILPWRCSAATGCLGYDNGQGGVGGEYVYGFRVPLLVVSAYAKQAYVSGECVAPGNCPNEVPPFIHDFGSILNFIEWVFGTGGQPLHFMGQPANSGISPLYPYADVFPQTPTLNILQACTRCLTFSISTRSDRSPSCRNH